MNESANKWMKRCFELAEQSANNGENRVGAVITDKHGYLIAEALERNRAANDVTCHAEIEVIRKALQKLTASLLAETILYTTHEPCVMCSYVIRHYKIAKVIYFNEVPEIGGINSLYPILKTESISNWSEPPQIVHWDFSQ